MPASQMAAENEAPDEAEQQSEELPDSLTYDTTLDDLVVTAKAKLIQSDGATLTYNVSEDPTAKTDNTLDILRKVPGVTVDAQDNIKVNGQSSFKIFLNGKEDPMLNGDIKTILKSMPANTIQKIEVISEPGAKYEAEGTGGILNIVTLTRQSLEGYLANIGLYMSNSGGGAYAYGRTKVRRVTAAGNVSYNNSFIHPSSRISAYTENINYTDPDQYRRTSDTHSESSNSYIGGSFNLSWEPDTLNLFTLGFNGMRNTYDSSANEYMAMSNADSQPVWSLQRDYTTHFAYRSLSLQASYQHTFRRTDHTLVGSYSYSNSRQDNDSYINTHDVVDYPDIDYLWSSNIRDSSLDSHIFQVDYSNQLTPRHLIEAGLKGNIKRAPSDATPLYGQLRDELVADEPNAVSLTQFDDILAAYASYSGKYSSWNVRAGLRYEFTHRGIRYHHAAPQYTDFTNRYNDWVPDASVSYNFGAAQNLRAAYQMRIARPSVSVLNPYRNTLTPGSVSYGNPDLKSEKTHNLSLSYSNYAHPLTGSIKATYYFSRNSVSDIIFTSPEMPGVVQSTYANIGTFNAADIELNLNWDINSSLSLGLWTDVNYINMHADSELLHAAKANWRTTINANANYTLPCKVRLSAYGGYGSPWADIQSKGASWYYYSLGISRSFLKEDRLSVSISAQNFLPSHRTQSWKQESQTAYIYSASRYSQWYVGLNVSWRLGGLNADVKRTAARITEEATTDGNSQKK